MLSACRLAASIARLFPIVIVFIASVASAAGNIVDYTYDDAGNLTNFKRRAAAGFAVTGFSPLSGRAGAPVTIYGTGFSNIASNNTVNFNGTTATVIAAQVGSISTTVPTGATTGRISVTVNGVTATSTQDFVVIPPNAPTVTSFTPASGAASTNVSVTGSYFDAGTGSAVVKLNGVAASSTITSSTTLTFTVPASTASGRISVETTEGVGESADDFVVPPSGVNAADIVTKVRLTPGGAASNVVVSSTNKHALILFNGASDGFYTVQLGTLAVSPSTGTLAYKVIKPDNTVLTTGFVGGPSYRPTIHIPKLPAAGTYSILLSSGTNTFNASARVTVDPTLVVDGSPANSALDSAYESARFAVALSAGQRVGIGVMNVATTPSGSANLSFTAYLPDGSALSSSTLPFCNGPNGGNPQGNCEGELLATVAGTYTLVAQTPTSNYSNFGIQLSAEQSGTLQADIAQDISLTRIGQDARFTFSATAGDSLGVDLSSISSLPQAQTFYVTVYKPDGTQLSSCTAGPTYGAYCELGSVPTTGTYSAFVDPGLGAYGTAKLTLKKGPLLSSSDPPTAFAMNGLVESARFHFSGAAGQNLAAAIEGLTYTGSSSTAASLIVYRPDRTQLGSAGSCYPPTVGGRCRLTLTNLPLTGEYSLVLLPPPNVKISGNANISADLTGSLVVGTPQSISATRSGQNARYTFSGTAGDSTSVKLTGVATTPANQVINVVVYRPDNGILASGSAGSVPATLLNLPSLPSTGTYTVLLDPFYGQPWQAQLSIDPGQLLAIDGATTNLSTSIASEPLRFRFGGTAGQRMEYGLSGLAYGTASSATTAISIYRPDGSSLTSATCGTSGSGSCEASSASLPTTGTYSIVATPPAGSTFAGGTLALSSPATGSLTVGGAAQTIAVTRPGQTARWTFSGSSGQLLRLNWAGTTVSGASTVSVTVLKPDASTHVTSSFANGATGGVDLPSLPVSGTYTVVYDPALAATMTAPTTLVTR